MMFLDISGNGRGSIVNCMKIRYKISCNFLFCFLQIYFNSNFFVTLREIQPPCYMKNKGFETSRGTDDSPQDDLDYRTEDVF